MFFIFLYFSSFPSLPFLFQLTMILLPQPFECWSTTPNGHFPSPTLALEVCSFRGSPHITHLSHVFVAVIKCREQEWGVEQVCFGLQLQWRGVRAPNGRAAWMWLARVGSWLVTFHPHTAHPQWPTSSSKAAPKGSIETRDQAVKFRSIWRWGTLHTQAIAWVIRHTHRILWRICLQDITGILITMLQE